MSPPRGARAAVLAVLLTACAQGGTEPAAEPVDDLRPAFPAAAEPAAGGGPSTAVPAPAPAPAGAATTATSASPPGATAAGATTPQALTATIADPTGDATPSVVDRPPAWADLAGATLTRSLDGFELRVELAGGRAPTTTDSGHTMSIASFYDVDGDGTIDYEVWANLSDSGWGGSWFDNTRGTGRFGDDAGVTWTPEGGALVMRFPLTHVGDAPAFRWSLASEWGRYEVLTTPASVRDDAPDDDQPAAFGG